VNNRFAAARNSDSPGRVCLVPVLPQRAKCRIDNKTICYCADHARASTVQVATGVPILADRSRTAGRKGAATERSLVWPPRQGFATALGLDKRQSKFRVGLHLCVDALLTSGL
jgi:hypothetical protein